jgi:4-carboxymuconolactone decarboxylase
VADGGAGPETAASVERAGRAPWLAPDQLDAEQRRVYDTITGGPRKSANRVLPLTDEQGRLYGPFNAMLLSAPMGDVLQALGTVVRYGTKLSGRAREIAILEVARGQRSNFEWYAHSRVGADAGLTSAELDALRVGADLDLDPDESIARAVSQAVVADGDLSDELFGRAEAQLGTATLADLLTLVGYYTLVATSLRVWRTPLPPGIDPVF